MLGNFHSQSVFQSNYRNKTLSSFLSSLKLVFLFYIMTLWKVFLLGGGATSNMFCLPWSHCFKLAERLVRGSIRTSRPVNFVILLRLSSGLLRKRRMVSSPRGVKTPCEKGEKSNQSSVMAVVSGCYTPD